MKKSRKLHDSLGNLRKAVDNLGEALKVSRTLPLATEGTIQRFETVVELVWKTLGRAMQYEGEFPKTPRETMKKGVAAGWLGNEIVWQELLDRRNATSHEYLDDDLINAYYDEIVSYYSPIEALVVFLEARYGGLS